MKTKGQFLLVSLLVIILMSSCATPVVVSTPIPIDTPTITLNNTLTNTLSPTMTLTPTLTNTPTVTVTSEPTLYCTDKIPGCYFLGNEIARIFARMTLPCFENGGECYPPVVECPVLPSDAVHISVENFATAWEAEVNGNSAYKDLLDPKLYDPAKQYCFVDEGIAQSVRDSGHAEYTANKACLGNEEVPCDVMLQFFKINRDTCGEGCQGLLPGAYLTEMNFSVLAVWRATAPFLKMDLENVMNGKPTANTWFNFAYVFISSTVGFDNGNPPVDIYIVER